MVFENCEDTLKGYRFTIGIQSLSGEKVSMGGVSKAWAEANFFYIQRALRKDNELKDFLEQNKKYDIIVNLFNSNNNTTPIKSYILSCIYKRYIPIGVVDASCDGPVLERFIFEFGE